eukprot:TRINITY_DN5076_c0_g1_i2.p2 TRINITY_DN5076_c0_g1~~TRINITY_DN5076_c0_g1_i2.p2  ORF type:complete len:454 (-),score=110.58 TRINITY_DN5076_c0_g1_i2:142-1503(-)
MSAPRTDWETVVTSSTCERSSTRGCSRTEGEEMSEAPHAAHLRAKSSAATRGDGKASSSGGRSGVSVSSAETVADSWPVGMSTRRTAIEEEEEEALEEEEEEAVEEPEFMVIGDETYKGSVAGVSCGRGHSRALDRLHVRGGTRGTRSLLAAEDETLLHTEGEGVQGATHPPPAPSLFARSPLLPSAARTVVQHAVAAEALHVYPADFGAIESHVFIGASSTEGDAMRAVWDGGGSASVSGVLPMEGAVDGVRCGTLEAPDWEKCEKELGEKGVREKEVREKGASGRMTSVDALGRGVHVVKGEHFGRRYFKEEEELEEAEEEHEADEEEEEEVFGMDVADKDVSCVSPRPPAMEKLTHFGFWGNEAQGEERAGTSAVGDVEDESGSSPEVMSMSLGCRVGVGMSAWDFGISDTSLSEEEQAEELLLSAKECSEEDEEEEDDEEEDKERAEGR